MSNETNDELETLMRLVERENRQAEAEAEPAAEADVLEEEPVHFKDTLLLDEPPVLAGNVPPHPALASVIREQWPYIRTYRLRITRNMTQYNHRWAMPTGPRLRQYLQLIFDRSRRPLFIVAMAGFYLSFSETEAGLFYAEENTQIFSDPSKLRSQADLDRYVAEWPSSARIIREFKNYSIRK